MAANPAEHPPQLKLQGWIRSLSLAVTVLAGACDRAIEPMVDRELPRWSLKPEVRIDGHEQELVPIEHFSVSESGIVAIAQPQDNNVRLFDPAGDPIRTIGREGQGPGEFRRIQRLGWLGDSLWIVDASQYRITLTTSAGEFIRSVPAPRPWSVTYLEESGATVNLGAVSTLGIGRDGTIPVLASRLPLHILTDLFGRNGMGPNRGRSPSVPRAPEGSTYARLSEDGRMLGVIARTWPTASTFVLPASGGAISQGEYPFPNHVHFERADDGRRSAIAAAEVDGETLGTFRVVMFSEAGDTLYDRTLPFAPEAIPPSISDSAVDRAVQGWTRFDRVAGTAYREQVYVPSVYPPIEQLSIGYDGSLWIRLRDDGGCRPYLVLDPAGEPAAEVLVPPNVEIHRASATHVWALEKDDVDVQSVVRFRIDRAASGGSTCAVGLNPQ